MEKLQVIKTNIEVLIRYLWIEKQECWKAIPRLLALWIPNLGNYRHPANYGEKYDRYLKKKKERIQNTKIRRGKMGTKDIW